MIDKFDVHEKLEDMRTKCRQISRFEYVVFKRYNNLSLLSLVVVDEAEFEENRKFISTWKDFFWRRLSEKDDCVYNKENVSFSAINEAVDKLNEISTYLDMILHRLRLYYKDNKTQLKELSGFKC